MAIIHYPCAVQMYQRLGSTLIYINILMSAYCNVFLHGNFLSCAKKTTNVKSNCGDS